jgi:transcriptional regulator with XRE-family HTH domain
MLSRFSVWPALGSPRNDEGVSMAEVARVAGVSVSTVSHVINGSGCPGGGA